MNIINRNILFFILSFFFLFSCGSKSNEYITIGTFNAEWLGDGVEDLKERSAQDYKNMAQMLLNLNADLICLQEVENACALDKLIEYMPNYQYSILPSRSKSKQNNAAIFKKDLTLNTIGEYSQLELDFGKTRPGLLLNIKKDKFDALVQIVHLKSSSRFDSTKELKEYSRKLRSEQAKLLSYWADSLSQYSENKNFIIIGDFNDSPIRKINPSLDELYHNKNLKFLTDSLKSCKFLNAYAIDHIIISKTLFPKYVDKSLFIYDPKSQFNDKQLTGLSDHCPIVVRFRIK